MKSKYSNYCVVATYDSETKKTSAKEKGLLRKLLPMNFRKSCWKKAIINARCHPESEVTAYYDLKQEEFKVEIDEPPPVIFKSAVA